MSVCKNDSSCNISQYNDRQSVALRHGGQTRTVPVCVSSGFTLWDQHRVSLYFGAKQMEDRLLRSTYNDVCS